MMRPNHRPHGTLGARPECHHTHAVVASWHHLAYNTEYDTRQRYCIYILERSTHPTGPDESTRPHDLTARRDPTSRDGETGPESQSGVAVEWCVVSEGCVMHLYDLESEVGSITQQH